MSTSPTVYCIACGQILPSGASFCPACGGSQDRSSRPGQAWAAPTQPGVSSRTTGSPAGGILGILGGVGLIASVLVPLTTDGSSQMLMVTDGKVAAGAWYAAEPVLTGAAALIAGGLLLGRVIRTGVGGGILIGIGIAEALMFLGYTGFYAALASPSPALGPGLGLGFLAALLILGGGLVAALERPHSV